MISACIALALITIISGSCKKEPAAREKLELVSCFAGTVQLQYAAEIPNVPLNRDLVIEFSKAVEVASAQSAISIKDESNTAVSGVHLNFDNDNKTVLVKHDQSFGKLKSYKLVITSSLKGQNGETFGGTEFRFKTATGDFLLNSILLNGQNFMIPKNIFNVSRSSLNLVMELSDQVDTALMKSKFTLAGSPVFDISVSDDLKTVNLASNQELEGYKKFYVGISSTLKSVAGYPFTGFNNWFMTGLDSTLKFPLITDDELLSLVQHQTFKFFYDYAHPASGMTRERYGSGDIVTTGGSGFGVMALIVGMERGFITRTEGITRLEKIIHFLETCNRFHGAWPHWINGSSGVVVPFGTKDNGGDLVETAFMAQGLLAMRQYLNPGDPTENGLINRITTLYEGIEWDWYTRGGQNVLYWHWSPNYGWDMNFKIQGYNETLITYILAASSPTHTIPATAYHQGYARSGAIKNGKTFYGYVLPVGYDYGGPLFFAHYSFLGLDPRNLSDAYANYWTQNVHHSLINWAYCSADPKSYPNYNEFCWGLTASDIPDGYGVSEPTNDRGVITPSAAISSLPYSPEQSMNAIRYFYYIVGDKLWGDYGFHDAFDVHKSWWADSYIAIDQGPEIVMIENYRTGLLWNLFMGAPEVHTGLTKLGFTY